MIAKLNGIIIIIMFMGFITKVKAKVKTMAKKLASKVAKKTRKLSVYSNLSKRSSSKKNISTSRDSQYLASLPKFSYKRLLFHLNPRRFCAFWFSKQGAIKALKILGIFAIIMCLFVGGLFAYFRKDLDAIRPSELAKSVQSNVNTYVDRNGLLLWEDKGVGDYKQVVESKDISTYLKQATVSIEDKDFYKHSGVSLTGLARAAINNFLGGSTQGGSTLTQQLIKQVFFSSESQKRGLNGIPRKVKEMILAIEVERMYNKDQILTLYLNESPYGGRRNGVESGAQTYFNKSAKDLTIAEAALLASIPQNPSVYNPYNVEGHEGLIARQQRTIDNMVTMKYITKAQAKEAKAYPILDHINPESDQYSDIKAPHFVQMVRSQLEDELGEKVLGDGVLKITTTLDLRIQSKLEEAMNDEFSSSDPYVYGFTDGAATVEDVKSGQILALLGSRDFNYPGFGQDNAATSFIQPGSNIKPFVYTKLFEKKPSGQLNFGSGSILKDENIDSLYGAQLENDDHAFLGDITIRQSLATSRNIPAVKAMYISGVADTISTIQKMGAKSYCTNGNDTTVGLAAAIGGCGVKQIDLVNAYATLARQGVYKPQSTVLEVKNNNTKKVLKKWVDPVGTQVIDKQSAYVTSDILADASARGSFTNASEHGFTIPGIKTGTKTGTSDTGGHAKDLWMSSFSPVIAMTGWLGNPDTTVLKMGNSHLIGKMIEKVMLYAHNEIYAPQGLWTTNEWFSQPTGVQRVGNEVYPSWWDKTTSQTKMNMDFDKLSKYKATTYTPALAKATLEVTKTIDPITKKEVYIAPDGYDASKDDNKHLATDVKPTISVIVDDNSPVVSATNKNEYTVTITPVVPAGTTYPISSIDISVDNAVVTTLTSAAPYIYTYTVSPTDISAKTVSIAATVTDAGLYFASTDASTGASVTFPAYKS